MTSEFDGKMDWFYPHQVAAMEMVIDGNNIMLTRWPDHDSHVQLYDIHWFIDLRIRAKKAKLDAISYMLKSMLNFRLMPYRRIRQELQGGPIEQLVNREAK